MRLAGWLLGVVLVVGNHTHAKRLDVIEQDLHDKLLNPKESGKNKPTVHVVVTQQQSKHQQPPAAFEKKEVQRRLSKTDLKAIGSVRGQGSFHGASNSSVISKISPPFKGKIDPKKIQTLYPFIEREGKLDPSTDEEDEDKEASFN